MMGILFALTNYNAAAQAQVVPVMKGIANLVAGQLFPIILGLALVVGLLAWGLHRFKQMMGEEPEPEEIETDAEEIGVEWKHEGGSGPYVDGFHSGTELDDAEVDEVRAGTYYCESCGEWHEPDACEADLVVYAEEDEADDNYDDDDEGDD